MLSVRLMEISKSDYFGFPRRANNIYQAVSLIGIMQLHDIVLSILALRLFGSVPVQIFNSDEFWKCSVECGIAARTIVQYGQIFPIDPYFTLGLLHEIGHAVMFFKAPELALEAHENSKQQTLSLKDQEKILFGFDYTELGGALMRLWHLPEKYQQVTAYHLEPQQADKSERQAVSIIHLAHSICKNPCSEYNRKLIQELKAGDEQLSMIPDNIEEIIAKEIKVNADKVLYTLSMNRSQKARLTGLWQPNE